jgi:hypothetical protein
MSSVCFLQFFVSRYSAIIIDCVRDISQDLNIPLDNVSFDETIYDTEESFVQGRDDDDHYCMSFDEMKHSVGLLISSNHGVRFLS